MSKDRQWIRTRSSVTLSVLIGLGLSTALASTFVGNPGNVSLAPMSGLVVTDLDVPLSEVVAGPCNQQTGDVLDVQIVNGRLEFPLPHDTCWLEVTLDASLLVFAHAAGESRTVSLELSLPTFTLEFDPAFSPPGETERVILELGDPDWTSASELLPPGNSNVEIGPQDPQHATLVSALVEGTTVRYDGNSNGYVDGPERGAAILAYVP